MATIENVTLSIPGAYSGTVTVSASAVIRFTASEVAAKARYRLRAVLVPSGEDELTPSGQIFVPPVLYQFTWAFGSPSGGPALALNAMPITAQSAPFQLDLVREVPVVDLNEDPGMMSQLVSTIPPTLIWLPVQDEIICRITLSPAFPAAYGSSEVVRVRLGK